MTLNLLGVNETGIITGYTKDTRSRKRLLAMGLTRNTQVTITRVAPLGDPLELKVRDFALTIRKDDAAQILITKV